MDENALYKLRYPIGTFKAPEKITRDHIDGWIETIEGHPQKIRRLVNGFSEAQLDTPYRPHGWTVRQVLHHLPDWRRGTSKPSGARSRTDMAFVTVTSCR